jgi:hypothetical protein
MAQASTGLWRSSSQPGIRVGWLCFNLVPATVSANAFDVLFIAYRLVIGGAILFALSGLRGSNRKLASLAHRRGRPGLSIASAIQSGQKDLTFDPQIR